MTASTIISLAALAAAVCGLAFVLSFVSWALCEPSARNDASIVARSLR